jgi:hypothetical protein
VRVQFQKEKRVEAAKQSELIEIARLFSHQKSHARDSHQKLTGYNLDDFAAASQKTAMIQLILKIYYYGHIRSNPGNHFIPVRASCSHAAVISLKL